MIDERNISLSSFVDENSTPEIDYLPTKNASIKQQTKSPTPSSLLLVKKKENKPQCYIDQKLFLSMDIQLEPIQHNKVIEMINLIPYNDIIYLKEKTNFDELLKKHLQNNKKKK